MEQDFGSEFDIPPQKKQIRHYYNEFRTAIARLEETKPAGVYDLPAGLFILNWLSKIETIVCSC